MTKNNASGRQTIQNSLWLLHNRVNPLLIDINTALNYAVKSYDTAKRHC